MRSRTAFDIIRYIAPMAIASAIGCGGAGPGAEGLGESSEAVTNAGLTASVAITSNSATAWQGTLTVTNGGVEPATNWQVTLSTGQSTITAAGGTGQVLNVGGTTVIAPRSGTIAAGGSTTFTLQGSMPSGATNWKPTVSLVDGNPPGTVYNPVNGWAADGIDHVAQNVATGALNLALAYENNKLANSGDANYALYDNFIWSSQAYVISGGRIAFDPNVPGYKYIPQQAMAALSMMQDAPEVASYLTAGLASCFADTKAGWVYSFRAGVLKGMTTGTTTTGSITGQIPDVNAYKPSGYNINSVVDKFSTVGLGKGGQNITTTLTSTASPTNDFWFGLLTYTDLASYPNTTAVAAKFNASGQTIACSPFNGPGGSANPYFTISLNGSAVPARFTGVGAQCYSTCTSVMVIDPVPYAEPGAYYDTSGNLVGTQANPFSISGTLYAVPAHQSQWATRVVNGVQEWGTFSQAVSMLGTTQYKYVKQM